MARREPRASNRPVTLADVARYAGVSTAVVSYVINDGPRPVAPATAERVREAVTRLGYRPNSHARALMSGKTGILGLIHPGTANPFFGEYSDVVYTVAAGHDTALLMASSAGDAAVERSLIDSLARRNVDGIIVMTSMTRADVAEIRDPGIPMLFVNCPFPVPGYRSIGPDALDGSRRIVDHLLDVHGHSSVALIAGETGDIGPDDRERGWQDALRTHRVGEAPSVRTSFSLDGGYDAARQLLRRTDRPTAIFTSSDQLAYGALHAIHDHGLRIPEDVAVVGFDGTAESAHTWPPLTLVRQPLETMATVAVENMLGSLPRLHTLYEMTMIIRRSCGCAPDLDRQVIA
ncbi:MAG TPA: LacI family DNA-binding transcriptional regulator [Microlunatus sp.]|nr:LacI family DNA-binding transcriptional regulator [Microlunatus sp.]